MDKVSMKRSWSAVMAGAALAIAAVTSARPAAATSLFFGGTSWTVKDSGGGLAGPGPNYFSNSTDNVWVDGSGLHLKITQDTSGHWNCAEVISDQSFGYGTYAFTLASPVGSLDPNAVLGLFSYGDDSHEVDIEFSQFGGATGTNAQYVVQPAGPNQLDRWTIGQDAPTTDSFQWLPYDPAQPGNVTFNSTAGPTAVLQQPAAPLGGQQPAHMNLWLYQGVPPSPGNQLEVVISGFSFTPYSGVSWSGVLPPINPDGSSIFKLGSTVPVKFQLTGASAGITNLAARLYAAKVSNNVVGTEQEADSTSAADTGNTFRYDSSSGQYIFNLGTKSLSQGTWQLRIDLGDGASHTVLISLR